MAGEGGGGGGDRNGILRYSKRKQICQYVKVQLAISICVQLKGQSALG